MRISQDHIVSLPRRPEGNKKPEISLKTSLKGDGPFVANDVTHAGKHRNSESFEWGGVGLGTGVGVGCGSIFFPFFFHQGRIVRKPINANPRLKVNRGFHLAH